MLNRREGVIIELLKYNFDIDFEINKRQYYNEYLGDTSIFLSSLFELEMKRNVIEWDKRWIDDCLIKIVNNQPDIISLNGEMIWGKENTTKQWTDPFYFELQKNHTDWNQNKIILKSGDLNRTSLIYEKYSINRDYWSLSNIVWRYVFQV